MPNSESWNALTRQKDTLIIDSDTLNGAFADFLQEFFYLQNQAIHINTPQFEITEAGALSIRGATSWLGLAGVPVSLQIEKVSNDYCITVNYHLIDDETVGRGWPVTDAFKSAPQYYNRQSEKFEANILEAILWRSLMFTVSSGANENAGIGFSGTALLNSIAGSLTPYLGGEGDSDGNNLEVTCEGYLVLPGDGITPASPSSAQIKDRHFPWELEQRLPGIHLSVGVALDAGVPGLAVSTSTLHVYSPLDEQWEAVHSIYAPAMGLSVDGMIGKNGVSVSLQVACDKTVPSLCFDLRGDGLSLTSFEEVAELTGSANPLGTLPPSLEGVFNQLAAIELEEFSLGINWDAGTPSVHLVRFKLALNDIDWVIWKDKLEITGLECMVEIRSPGHGAEIDVKLWGDLDIAGVPVLATAAKRGDSYFLSASLRQKQSLPLESFASHYFPFMHIPAKLTIDTLQLQWDSAEGFMFLGSLAEKPDTWTIELGSQKLVFSDIHFCFEIAHTANTKQLNTSSPAYSAMLAGELQIGQYRLAGNYHLPGDFQVVANIPEVDLGKIYRSIAGGALPAPKGFNPSLTDVRVVVAERSGHMQCSLLASIPDVGTLGFQVQKTESGELAGVIAIDMPEVHPAKLPGFSFLKPIEKVVNISDCLFTATTAEGVTLNLPDASQFQAPVASGRALTRFGKQPKLTKGLKFSCVWQLDTKDKGQQLLQHIFGLNPTLETAIIVDLSKPSSPAVEVTVDIETHFQGEPFSGQFGLRIVNNEPAFFVAGRTQLAIDKRRYDVDMQVALEPAGIAFEGSLLGSIHLHGLTLSDLALMGSIDWAGVPGIGFSGEVDIGNTSLALTMLLDSATGGTVLAGAISEVTAHDIVYGLAKAHNLPKAVDSLLKQIALEGTHRHAAPASNTKAFTARDFDAIRTLFSNFGFNLSSSDNDLLLVERVAGRTWTLADRSDRLRHYSVNLKGKQLMVTLEPQAYICPVATQIGDLRFDQGFYLTAGLKISHFEAQATVNISPARGFSLDAEANEPLVVFNRTFMRLTDVTGKRGPQLSVSTYSQPKNKDKNLRSPHIYASGALYSMGMEVADAYALVNDHGLSISANCQNHKTVRAGALKGAISSGWSLAITVKSLQSMSAAYASRFKLGLTLQIIKTGKVHITESFSGKIAVKFEKGVASATFDARCTLAGEKLHIRFTINTKSRDLRKIEQTIAHHIEHELTQVFNKVEKFVDGVGKGIIKGFEDDVKLAKTLDKDFKQEAYKVIKAFDKLGKDERAIGRALKHGLRLSPDDAAKELKKLNKSNAHIAKVLKQGFNASGHDIGNALKGIGAPEKAINSAMKAAGVPAKDISNFCNSAFNDVAKGAKKAEKSAEKFIKGLF